MKEDPENLIAMMKADVSEKEPSEPTSSTYLVVDGKKITDPKEIMMYVKENMMGEEDDMEEEEKPMMDEESMRREALDGLNLN